MKKFLLNFFLIVNFTSLNVIYCQDLNTILMNSTYQIIGYNRIRETNISGTCFIIGKPNPFDSTISQFVLVTAKHIFEDYHRK